MIARKKYLVLFRKRIAATETAKANPVTTKLLSEISLSPELENKVAAARRKKHKVVKTTGILTETPFLKRESSPYAAKTHIANPKIKTIRDKKPDEIIGIERLNPR